VDYNTLNGELKSLIIKTANLRSMQPTDIGDEEPLFKEGLGLDSIDLLEIVVQLERKYGIKIQNNDTGRLALRNTANLTKAIMDHIGACPSPA
jgi:acyl carrier protein